MAMDLEQMQLAVETLYDILDDMLDKMSADIGVDEAVVMSDLSIDEFIADDSMLLHADTKRKYDPVKAHEYYIRTRKLKGRTTKSLNDAALARATSEKNTGISEKEQQAFQKSFKEYLRKKELLKQPDGDLQLLKERRERWRNQENRKKSQSVFDRLKRSSEIEIEHARNQFNDGIAAIKELFNG
jgi:hypothetical protein